MIQTQKSYQINIQGTNQVFACKEDDFLFDAMVRSGSGPFHYGCCGGGCGVCKMKIVSGKYSIEKKMSRAHVTEDEQGNDIVLICCVKPRSDLEIMRVN